MFIHLNYLNVYSSVLLYVLVYAVTYNVILMN